MSATLRLIDALVAAAGILRKRAIPFSLTGGLAANAWLPDERTRETRDVDFAVLVDDLRFVGSVRARVPPTSLRPRSLPRISIFLFAPRPACHG